MVIPCPECGAPLLEVSDTTSCSACSRSFTAGDLVREAAGLVDSAGGLSVRKEAESHARAMKLCDRAIAILTPLRESGRDGLTGLLAAAHMNRGTALRWDADPRALGDYDRALELLDRPENAGHHRSLRAVLRIHRALALEGMGERARAVEDELDEAWAEDLPPLLEAGAPGAVPIALECLELLLAGYTALDRDACGLEVAEEAIDRLPGEPGVYDQVSEWLMRLSWSERTSENRRERTRALFGRMVRSHRLFFGDNARGASLEARFALALDRAGEAVGLLRAYRARCPLDPAGAAGLAEVLALLGEAGDAREVLGAVPDLLLAGAAGATAAEREDLAPYASWLRGELLELGLGLCLGGLRTELDPWCLGENRRAREAALAWIGRIERAAGAFGSDDWITGRTRQRREEIDRQRGVEERAAREAGDTGAADAHRRAVEDLRAGVRRWRPRVLSAAASLGLPAAGNLAILEGEWRAGAAAIGSGADGAEAASRLAVGLVLGFAGRWSAAARDRSDGWAREVAGPHWARLERLSRQALAATGALLAAAKGRGFGPVARLGILQVVEGELRSKHFAPAGGAAIDALRLPEVPPDLRRMLRGPPAGILDRLIELRDRAAREVLRPEETSAGEEDAAATEEVLRLSFDPAEGLLPLVLTAPRGDPPAEIRARISPGAGA